VSVSGAWLTAAYYETGHKLFLATLITSFLPLLVHFFMCDYELDDRHNAVEQEIVGAESKGQPVEGTA
jgi:hypothetical protein